ncbi:hypothetical protein TcCL_Unassigned05656, partial [Trypanosoma cruzi]
NPPLVGQQRFAVLTRGGGSGGRGGPISSVWEGRRYRHKGPPVICRACAILPKSGQESHRSCARSCGSWHNIWPDTSNGVFAMPTIAGSGVVCAFLFLLDFLPA